MSRADLRPVSVLAGLAALVILVAPPAVRAEEGEERDTRGHRSYVGLGFSYGFENFDRGDASDIDDAAGLNAWMGYRFDQYWALETQLEFLFGYDLTIAGLRDDGEYVAVTLNAKVFPLAEVLPERIEPFLYAGVGGGRFQVNVGELSDLEEVAFLARFGGGADLYVLEDLALQFTASYVQPTGELNSFPYVSTMVGIQYRF